MQTIQDVLKTKRKELCLSLRKAAKLIGISHSYLSTLEKGMDPRTNAPINPTPETLKLISKAYNISYNELMEISGYISTTKNNKPTNKNEVETLAEDFLDILIKHGKIKTKEDLTAENIFSILNEIFVDIKRDND